jgi:putative ABC transport system permease protein
MIENIRVALLGLRSNKLRSALTMLGITIGVAAVIILVSLGQALESFILGQFEGIGTNLVYVFGTVDGFGRPQPLTESDLDALSDPYRVPDALGVSASYDIAQNLTSSVSFEGTETSARVIGVHPRYFEVASRSAQIGRIFTDDEVTSAARVAVIGVRVVENLFANIDPIGQSIRVQGVRLQVIGVMNEKGSGGFGPGSDQDNMILIPLTTAQTRFASNRTVTGERAITAVIMEARDDSRVQAVADQARQTLREEHEISFRDEDDFTVATQEELLASVGSVTGLLTIFLGVIAGISLVVGGIGIMNIMLVTVTERTREIGLRKAVGAQRRDILFQFLVEATVLALVGGGIGVGIATGMAALATANVPNLTVIVQPSSVSLATIISVAIGVFFGIYPANRAAALNPIDALRYE